MLLALLRHGIAEAAGRKTGGRDAPRALTDEGARRMRAAAAGMRVLGLAPELVVSSPLVRCAQTAQIAAATLGCDVVTDRRLAAGMGVGELLELLAMHAWAGELLLCGHEPDLSRAVAFLTGGSVVEMKKGALAVLELGAARAGGACLTALLPPRALRAAGGGRPR